MQVKRCTTFTTTKPALDRGGLADRCAFTLIELLVVIAVLAMLIGLLLPGLAKSMAASRKFRCQVSMRSIGFDFNVFADDTLHGDRGDDERVSPRFRLETFQESEYGIDEFWRWGQGIDTHELPDADNNDPMRCPEVNGYLTLRRGVPCRGGALSPSGYVSYTFNGRLDRTPSRRNPNRWTQATLLPSILDAGMVPLAWDVDGMEAERRSVSPVFSAPGLDTQTGPFANDAMWFPSSRHLGGLNVLFLDGHVEFTKTPLEESTWRWDYLAP